jgi:Tol biopolymer transport system component
LAAAGAVALGVVLFGVFLFQRRVMPPSSWGPPSLGAEARGARAAGGPHPHPVRFTLTLPNETELLDGAQFAVSPDGMHLVVAARSRDRRTHLLLRGLQSLEWRELPRTEGATLPFWSPDSRHVGFFADRRLKRIDISTSLPQTICDAPAARGGTWGSRGDIVFAGSNGLSKVPASGGTPQTVTQDRGGPHAWPQFLPDGRRFVFATVDGKGSTVVSNQETGETREVAAGRGPSRVAADFLLLSRGTMLEAQPLDARHGELIGEPRSIPGADRVRSDPMSGPEFSASSTVLVYRRRDRQLSELAWFDREGRLIDSMRERDDYASFAVSPSGQRVAVVRREREGNGASIWLHDVSGGRVSRLTQGASEDRFPVWSPDERRIAFRSGQSSERDVFVTSADGGGAEDALIRSEPWKVPTDWSRDGRFLIYTARSPKTGDDIWMFQVMGDGKAESIVQGPGNESQAVLSPDIRWIAYTSDESGSDEVLVRRFPPMEGRWQISSGGGTRPRWSPDGRELYYLSGDGSLMTVEVSRHGAAIRSSPPRMLFRTQFAEDFAVHNGRFLIRLPVEEPADRQLEVVLNWMSELRR